MHWQDILYPEYRAPTSLPCHLYWLHVASAFQGLQPAKMVVDLLPPYQPVFHRIISPPLSHLGTVLIAFPLI